MQVYHHRRWKDQKVTNRAQSPIQQGQSPGQDRQNEVFHNLPFSCYLTQTQQNKDIFGSFLFFLVQI
jgi:hypothetical protein